MEHRQPAPALPTPPPRPHYLWRQWKFLVEEKAEVGEAQGTSGCPVTHPREDGRQGAKSVTEWSQGSKSPLPALVSSPPLLAKHFKQQEQQQEKSPAWTMKYRTF